jgi:hypothetical protein
MSFKFRREETNQAESLAMGESDLVFYAAKHEPFLSSSKSADRLFEPAKGTSSDGYGQRPCAGLLGHRSGMLISPYANAKS